MRIHGTPKASLQRIPSALAPACGSRSAQKHLPTLQTNLIHGKGDLYAQKKMVDPRPRRVSQRGVNTGLFYDSEPVHMTSPGSFMAAECTLAGLKSLPDSPVIPYLSSLGRLVPTVDQLAAPLIVPGH